MIQRSITPTIKDHLDSKLILLSGPRQVGKTYLSKNISKNFQYYNFDSTEDKADILKKTWVRNSELIILDEIHKLKKWKSWIKGVYDTEKGKNQFILTGSARLDTFKKSGDSLAGRHISLRLNPFSVKEVGDSHHQSVVQQMLKLGCFPEPFLSGSEKKSALWRKSHLDVILRHDLPYTETVKDINSIILLLELLKQRVGQQIVYKNLADDLGVSPITVKKWIQVLESFFIIFTVYPFTKNIAEAIKKEPKIYFYDIAQTQTDIGFKLENLVALHFLKRNQFLEDTEGKSLRLCYIRDKKKREVDFAIEENGKLTHLIEIKNSDDHFNSNLNYFSNRLQPKISLQLVMNLKREKDYDTYMVRHLSKYLFELET